jgi:hypothetical protein
MKQAHDDKAGRHMPFPNGLRTITAMRIRSNELFLVRYLWWGVFYEHSDPNEQGESQ